MAIAQALGVNRSLSDLNLRGVSVGGEGEAAIAEALGVNNTLTTLNFGSYAELRAAVAAHRVAMHHLTPEQRLAFLSGQRCATSNIRRLPLDVIRRILLKYKVAQGVRYFDRNNILMATRSGK